MAYRLKPGRPAGDELRRVATEQLESAALALRDADAGGRSEAVHTARKALKRTRAMLRLARPGLPPAAYRAQMDALRDTGRMLSGARDAVVLVETTGGLADQGAERIPARAFQDLKRDVRKLAAVPSADDELARAAGRLDALAAGVEEWPLRNVKWPAVREGAKRSYARGRDDFRRARRSSDPEVLHEWRKRVKDHWYHQQLLRNAWKPVMRASADEADRLAELLGDDHDLANLGRFLQEHRGELDGHLHLDDMRQLIAERRAELRAEAIAVGERIYAERPKAYGRRTGRYLTAARTPRSRSASAAASEQAARR